MKKLFTMAALAAAAVSVSAEVTPRSPIVPWGAQAEIIITNDLTQQNSDGSWSLTAEARQWIEYSYDGSTENGTIQQTNRPNVWYNFYSETTTTVKEFVLDEDGNPVLDEEGNKVTQDKEISCDEMIPGDEANNWAGYLTVTSKTGSTSGLMVVGKNRYPTFYVTGTDKAKFYFSGSAGTAGYPQIEVYEADGTEPVATKTGDIALTKSTWNKSTLLIADGLDKAKSYKIVARTMNLIQEKDEEGNVISESFGYAGGDIVLQVVKLYGDQAPMREDGLIISGSEIGSYINQHLAAYPDVTDFTLEGNGKYTVTESIVFSNAFTLSGSASAPATIDASALNSPFIQMNSEPVIEAVESGQFVITAPTKIENIKVTGLTKNFFADGGKGYAFVNFTVNNVVAQYDTQSGVVLNFAAGMAINFNITNSTFYSNEPGTGNFIALSGKRPWQITGYEEETGKLTVAKNTFYNVAKGKQFLNTNTLKGQRYLYEFNSNIFVDVSNKKIYGNMTNNANQLTTDGLNTYLFDGEFFAETNYNGDEGLQCDPSFKNAAAGDFTIDASTLQAKYKTGAPRWLVAYATDAIKIEVDQSENTDWVAAINAALAESEAPSSITVQFFEAGEYPTTAELNTTSPITIQNGSDIDAGEATIIVNNGMTLGGAIKIDGINLKAGEELEAPAITLQGNEYKLQDNGFYNLGSIQFKNLSIKGFTQQIVYGNKVKNQISELLVENSNVDLTGCTKVPFDFNGGGAIGAFNIKKSTVWAAEPTSQSLFSTQSGNKATEAGYTTQNFAIDNSTLYNIAKSKNFFTHRQANQTWIAYYLRNNIFISVGKSGQVVKGINQGQSGKNPKWTVSGNAFLFANDEGVLEDTSAAESTGDDDEPVQNSIVTNNATFAGLTEGNFDGTLFTEKLVSSQPGDPRWNLELVFKPTIALYIYNAYSGKFLSRGDAWGTRAVGDNYGLPFNVTEANGKYTLNLIDWEGTCYGDDYWMYADCSGDRARSYTLEATTGGFFLHNTNRAEAADNRMYIYLKDDADKYAIAGNAIVGDAEGANCDDEAQAVWQFLSQEERDKIVEKNNVLQNALAMTAADYDLDDIDNLEPGEEKELTFKTGSSWQFTAKRNGSNAVTNDYGTEIYQGTGSFTQTVEGLDPGLYLVGIQAFYRDGWNANVAELYKKGYNLSTAYLDANGYTAQVQSWGAACTEVLDEEGNITGYKPNSMAEAAEAFGEEKYDAGVLTYVGEDGKLNLTLYVPTFINGGWFIADNVTYAKLEEPAAAGEVTYALVEGETFTSGQIVEVKIEDDVVATIQYGEEGGADFNAATADSHLAELGYTATTGGNGTNGNKAGGTFYTIVPKYDGVVAAAVVLNADKKFHLVVDGVQNPVFDNNTVSEKYYGPVEFNVAAGKSYKFYCDGSKLGFYGFNYKFGPDVEAITEISVAEQMATVGIEAVETATVNSGAVYNLNGQKMNGTLKSGLYIINGKKVLVK